MILNNIHLHNEIMEGIPSLELTGDENVKTKLSKAQCRVMKWLVHGWSAQPGAGTALMVNGQRICNIDTMTALQRAGLVQCDEQRCWKVTESGRAIFGRL